MVNMNQKENKPPMAQKKLNAQTLTVASTHIKKIQPQKTATSSIVAMGLECRPTGT